MVKYGAIDADKADWKQATRAKNTFMQKTID
jgi:hypothetical protein